MLLIQKDTSGRILDTEFFNRDVLLVTAELLGKVLCREIPGQEPTKHIITEAEAYDGAEDMACHANRGVTPRTFVMFGPAGRWYVYLCYGIHWMLNIVVGPESYPAAILIRSVDAYTGPGRLTKALCINKSLNNLPAYQDSGLWIEDHGLTPTHINRTPRIGIDYAGPIWSQVPYRFIANTFE